MNRLITAALMSSFLLVPTLATAAEKEAKPPHLTAKEIKTSLRPSEVKATAKAVWNHDTTNMMLVSGWAGGRSAIAHPGGPKEKFVKGASTAVGTAVLWKLTSKFLSATAPRTPEQKAQSQVNAQQARTQAQATGSSYLATRLSNAIRTPR